MVDGCVSLYSFSCASSCSWYIQAWFDFVLSTARMRGGDFFYLSPSIYRVESKAFRLINALHLTSQLLFLKLCHNVASLFISYKSFFDRCSEEPDYCASGPRNWGRSTRPLCRMNFVLKLAIWALIDIVLDSFLTHVICRILYLIHFFLPLTIFFLSLRVYRHLRGIDRI